MNYRLPDEEYAVLDYIRSRSGTHIDHLKIAFGPVAVTAVDHLYQYGLIDPDFPDEDIYCASDLGKAYRHEEAEQKSLKVEQESECSNNCKSKKKKKFYKRKSFWAIVVAVTAVFAFFRDLIFDIISLIQG